MSSRLYFCRTSRPDRAHWLVGITVAACLLGGAQSASAGAPDWMQALVNVPLPEHDDKTDAIRLYSEKILVVDSNGKIKTIEREAYKILRPDGDFYGVVKIPFDSETKITHLKAWCIPAQGK